MHCPTLHRCSPSSLSLSRRASAVLSRVPHASLTTRNRHPTHLPRRCSSLPLPTAFTPSPHSSSSSSLSPPSPYPHVCVSGNIFALTEKDRPTEYISNEPRDQYGAEGLILGFIMIAASSMLVLCNLKAFEGRQWTAKGSTVGALWAGISPVLRPELCCALMLFFWFLMVNIYTWKNRGYRNGFVWY